MAAVDGRTARTLGRAVAAAGIAELAATSDDAAGGDIPRRLSGKQQNPAEPRPKAPVKVEITEQGVSIGEDTNIVRLSHAE
jgi:hypothetical protein